MLEKHYTPQDVETRLYTKWEEKGWFEPDLSAEGKKKEPFAIMMPPPNVTGTLHVGHALDNTLPDMLVRRARMEGKNAIYQPGTDHASIAVHVVLDRQFREEGTNRFELGREEFMKRAWKWKEHSHGVITTQMRRLGVSCAWQRERFTMDDGLSDAVQKVFIDLYNKGLIYRGTRLVNWDPNMQTAVSDLEVKHKEVEGSLWHFKYFFAEGEKPEGYEHDYITLATTRPETIMADCCIAINPEDERAAMLVGKKVIVPLMDREIPIIADEYAKPEFGSGMVKITAAHDFNDYEVWKRHYEELDLPIINLLNKNGTMNDNAHADFVGLDRFAARKKILEVLTEKGHFVKTEKNTHQVPHAERDDTILEPFLTRQWYVKGKPLAEKCLKAAADGDVKFVNKRDEKIYHHWLENIQDWCISRQLWWGHRIPAWFKGDEIYVGAEAPTGEGWEQDPDILDTWFSSALWPFSTLGWPEKTDALEAFFPQHAIMPGRDILFFWIIRMMMMSLEFMEAVPFETIYTHAMVLDEQGQKMSKSKGNVMDPLVLADKYGTDALRYALVHQAAIGQDIRLGEQTVEQSRNFCTKIWNATRFAMMNGAEFDPSFDATVVQHPFNKAIISKFGQTVKAVNDAMDAYRFNEVGHQLYQFTWNTYCDWYLELTKPLVYGEDASIKAETLKTMGFVLERLMRLMHPMMPYITEEIWLKLTENCRDTAGETIMYAGWPKAADYPYAEQAEENFNLVSDVVTAIRNARAENNVPPKGEIEATIRGEAALVKATQELEPFIAFLTKTTGFKAHEGDLAQTDVVAVARGAEIILPLEGVVDFEAERERIAKEIAKFEAELQKINGMLNNENFVARAPEAVVNEQKERKEALMGDLAKLKTVLDARA